MFYSDVCSVESVFEGQISVSCLPFSARPIFKEIQLYITTMELSMSVV